MRNGLIVALWVLGIAGARSDGAANFQTWGTKFVPQVQIDFKVPKRSFEQIPAKVGLYAAEPTPFTPASIAWILDTVLTDPAEKETLKRKVADNPSLLVRGKSQLKQDNEALLVVNPEEGTVSFAMQPDLSYRLRSLPSTPGQTNLIAPDVFNNTLRQLVTAFGIDSSEVEKKPGGSYHVVFSDSQKYPNHQNDPVVYARSVTYNRCIEGYPAASTDSAFEIQIERFAGGPWKRLYIHWPRLNKTGTRPTYHSNAELERAVRSGKAFWDHNNEFAPDDVHKITINNIRLIYSVSKSGRASPVLCLDADMKAASGTDYGVLLLPLE